MYLTRHPRHCNWQTKLNDLNGMITKSVHKWLENPTQSSSKMTIKVELDIEWGATICNAGLHILHFH